MTRLLRRPTADGEAEAAHGRSRATIASTRRARKPPPTRSLDLRLDARSGIAASSTNTPAVQKFAETLEKVCVDTVEAGSMTKDLALLIQPGPDLDDHAPVPRQG